MAALVWRMEYISRHNGDEEELVNGSGGQQYCDNIHEAWISFREHTCFFCSRGIRALCRVEEGRRESERG